MVSLRETDSTVGISVGPNCELLKIVNLLPVVVAIVMVASTPAHENLRRYYGPTQRGGGQQWQRRR